MTKVLTSIVTSLFFVSFFYAQPKEPNVVFDKNITVKGKVVDKETQLPLEYASIAFFSKKENKIVDGGITDVNGEFSIIVNDGIYDISIEYISYKKVSFLNKKLETDEDLGIITLEIDYGTLDAVEIIAERTTVEIKLDKKIYNVGKDLTVSGGTVSDVLDNIPSVTVDVEGNVALRGNDNVRILINGKPSGLVGLNSTEALRQLPAESIERVEVITSPSARYESEGTAGILNIILRRSKLQGFNGALTTNVGYPDAAGISGNVNYRTGDVNFFNTTGYNYRETLGNSYTFTQYKENGNYLDEKQDWVNTRKGLTSNIGVEWYINDSASLTTSLVYSDNDSEQDSKNRLLQYDNNFNLTGETNRLDPEVGNSKTIQYATNFTKNFNTSGHKLSFDFQYEESNQNENSLIITNGVATDKVDRLDSQTDILLQTDYVLPIGDNSQFELGYRGGFNTRKTDFRVELLNTDTNEFEVDNDLSNLFNFKLYINALYTQFGSKIDKFSYLFGLRLEDTQITIDQPTSGDFEKKRFTGLFPTINFSYELSDSQSITLGYSRRIQRPRSFYLNPFPSRTSLTNIFQGNPDLDPSYSGLYDLGYLNRFEKVTISSSIYYQHETNDSNWVSSETGETVVVNGTTLPVIRRTPVNLATNDRYGFEFNVNYSPSRKWRVNTDFNLFKSVTRGDYEGVSFDAENISWNIRLSNKYTLPGKIDWQTNIDYRGPSEDAQNTRKAIASANMALSKDLFNEKASIAFNISDIFNSRRYKGDINTPTFTSTRDLQFRGGQTVNLSFTYRFNQKKKPERQRGGESFEIEG
ncbi:TonB-dependent receptor [Sabulilitoribacter multivorans]|uniref:TonB-dependent receptor n=1 Tax=Flaviramulus multivorans TaxID=1304750 RepID=A0ABS9IIQ2_9FLAO|nr:TonB-dependent receptor [Flaviramulus multivorans]MCF7560047.1 TonB-dependent receptor [Flaviramulus multivorans]